MNDGSILPLSQKKSKEFRVAYKAYVGQNSAKITQKPNKNINNNK
jgi:hypothetical protein